MNPPYLWGFTRGKITLPYQENNMVLPIQAFMNPPLSGEQYMSSVKTMKSNTNHNGYVGIFPSSSNE